MIITYNEERIIARSIDSLNSVVDEVIIVDSFSTDRTIEICKEKGAVVLQNKFEGYKTQKHFAATKAKHEWILSIDADEVGHYYIGLFCLDFKCGFWQYYTRSTGLKSVE